jgi:hypothetical protein
MKAIAKHLRIVRLPFRVIVYYILLASIVTINWYLLTLVHYRLLFLELRI